MLTSTTDTMTWLLVGTTRTWYGRLPATASASERELPYDPDVWLDRLREQIDAGTDWPLVQIPRERHERFRPQVRVKSWSFVTWLLARHPDRWADLLRGFPREPVPLPEQIPPVFDDVLGRPLEDVEAEWREWARGDTYVSMFGATRNPYDPERTVGGSSGGSGAALAANLSTVSLGEETLASIRRPGGWNGVVSMRPTPGLVSRTGTPARVTRDPAASSTTSPHRSGVESWPVARRIRPRMRASTSCECGQVEALCG